MRILPLCLATTTYKQLIKTVGFIGENPLLKEKRDKLIAIHTEMCIFAIEKLTKQNLYGL